jgi:lipopolysaccharide/colanic/teichoic acid biosynthesis glycosyltransferase
VAAPQPRPSDSFVERFSTLVRGSAKRRVDLELRALDVVFSALFLLLALPLLLLICAALLVTSGAPLFYRGERVGRDGRIFGMLKFRTLRRGAEERLGPYLGEELVQRTREETTAVGRRLRAAQLDELPQLWNVLRGDMSLVGPRPIRPRFFEQLAAELPAYWQRLVVRPGLTGFAQVRRGYETSMAEKLAHDLEWIVTAPRRSTCARSPPPRPASSCRRSRASSGATTRLAACAGSAGSSRRTAPPTRSGSRG